MILLLGLCDIASEIMLPNVSQILSLMLLCKVANTNVFFHELNRISHMKKEDFSLFSLHLANYLHCNTQWLKYKFGGPGTTEIMGPSVPNAGAPDGNAGPQQSMSKAIKLMQMTVLQWIRIRNAAEPSVPPRKLATRGPGTLSIFGAQERRSRAFPPTLTTGQTDDR